MHTSSRRKTPTDKGSTLLRASLWSILVGLSATVLFLLLATAITYAQADPLTLSLPAALITLYASVAVSGACGALRSRKPLLSGGITGAFFLLLTLILALLPIGTSTSSLSTGASVAAYAGIPLTSIVAAYLAVRQPQKAAKRRRKR